MAATAFNIVEQTIESRSAPKLGGFAIRDFGKSLLVSTMEAIFEGKRHLFEGLEIDRRSYDWKAYSVIKLGSVDFSTQPYNSSNKKKK